jgi:NADH:ubiquinone oxidoreductase subunit E
MKIELCMGSSCHVKGSQSVLDALKDGIRENKLEGKVILAGSVCLGACKSGGANLKLDGEVVTGITKENFPEFFETRVKKPLGL